MRKGSTSYSNNGSMQNSMMSSTSNKHKSRKALVPIKQNGEDQNYQANPSSNKIRVCIRVRPLLPHEMHKDEVVYYPQSEDSLEVS
jgi:hypothetical protein